MIFNHIKLKLKLPEGQSEVSDTSILIVQINMSDLELDTTINQSL